jgi:hypothetical protein
VRLPLVSVYRPVILVEEEPVLATAIASPDVHGAIPPALRAALGIQPGPRVQVLLYQSRLELIPLRAVRDMRGFRNGMETTVAREPDRP